MSAFYPPEYLEFNLLPGQAAPFAIAQADIAEACSEGPATVLDIGCASGSFLGEMLDRGWRVAGVERSDTACRVARRRLGSTVKCGVLERDDFSAHSFDVVTLWSALEHLHDPLGTLRIVRRVIKRDGHLLFVVPNWRSLERMVFRDKWFALDVPRHLYHFEPRTLTRMLEACDFEVEKLSHASGHDTLRFSLRMWSRRSPSRGPAAEAATGRSRGRGWLKRRCVDAWTTIADRARLGSQVLVIARPSGPR